MYTAVFKLHCLVTRELPANACPRTLVTRPNAQRPYMTGESNPTQAAQAARVGAALAAKSPGTRGHGLAEIAPSGCSCRKDFGRPIISASETAASEVRPRSSGFRSNFRELTWGRGSNEACRRGSQEGAIVLRCRRVRASQSVQPRVILQCCKIFGLNLSVPRG